VPVGKELGQEILSDSGVQWVQLPTSSNNSNSTYETSYLIYDQVVDTRKCGNNYLSNPANTQCHQSGKKKYKYIKKIVIQ
jgi:hypothetical protein